MSLSLRPAAFARPTLFLLTLLAAFVLAGFSARQASATIYYVSSTGSDANAGTSWTTAKQTVQAGINAAASGDQVWVATGTYTENITAVGGEAVYGGFAGTETSIAQRTLGATPTILDGGNNSAVYTIPSAAQGSDTFDGFTVQHGNSYYGGGLYDASNYLLTVSNCTFTQNTATEGGGGMSSGAATVSNSVFTGNNAGGYGGGLAVGFGSTVADCTFTDNSSGVDGGGADSGGGTTFIDCTFTGNSAAATGGGIFLNSNATIVGCTLTGNVPSAVYSFNTAPDYPLVVKDCLIVGAGTASSNPDGIDFFVRGTAANSDATVANNTIVDTNIGININTSTGTVSVANTILDGNGGGLDNTGGVTITSSHNDIYGNINYGYAGTTPSATDLAENPMFVNAGGGDYHLAPTSPLIDAGDDSQVTAGDMDLDGHPRIQGSHVDIGCYEFVPAPTITSFTPTSGPVGTSVTITGTNFTGATAVNFNAATATTFTIVSATSITATVPTGATTGKVSVTTPGGTATSSGTFTVTTPPTITSIAPTSGPVGTVVTITGTNFVSITKIRFHNAYAATYSVNGAGTQITVTVPSGAGTGTITVTTSAGAVTSGQTFTVTAPPPTITSISPTSGPVGTVVTITGTNFVSITKIRFHNAYATTYSVNGAGTQITVTVPSGAGTGTITVTTAAGAVTSSQTFTVTTSTLPGVRSLTFNPSTIAPGGSSTGTVTLSGVAPQGGSVVSVSQGAFTFTTVTVPAGQTTATFGVMAVASAPAGSYPFTAAYNSTSATGTLTVN